MLGWPGDNEQSQANDQHYNNSWFLYIDNTADPLMGLLVYHCSFVPQPGHDAAAAGPEVSWPYLSFQVSLIAVY
jgi:hypothetical protein